MPDLFRNRPGSTSGSKRKKLRIVVGAVLIVTSFGIVMSPASQPYQGQSDHTIKVNVREVLLHATVTDHKGKVVSGLSRENFQVYDNGVPQRITYFTSEDVPVTVGQVIDGSGSMQSKRSEVLAGARALLRSSNAQDEVFTVNFNERVSFGLPDDMPFTTNMDLLEAALFRSPASGETALYDAVAAALDHLKRGSRDKKVLIVISDGGDNASKLTWSAIKDLVAHSNATIYTIGIFDDQDTDKNPRVLKELAKQTGGEAFLPADLKKLVPVCEQIAHDIRNQYTIGYIPADPSDGYRTIEVKAVTKDHTHVSVRTRAGYFAQSSASTEGTARTTQ